MSDATPVRLTITCTESYTIETTEADIRAAMDRQNIGHDGLSLEGAIDQLDGWSGELVLSALASKTGPDEQTWALDEWETDGDE